MSTAFAIALIVFILIGILSQSKKQTQVLQRAAHEQTYGPIASLSDVSEEVMEMLKRGDDISAVRRYRQITHCDLAIADEKIKRAAATLSPRQTGFSPGFSALAFGAMAVGLMVFVIAVDFVA